MIAALNCKIAFDRARLLKALVAALRGVQLGLQMRVRQEQKGKIRRVRLPKDRSAERP